MVNSLYKGLEIDKAHGTRGARVSHGRTLVDGTPTSIGGH